MVSSFLNSNPLSIYVSGRSGVFIDESNLFHSQKTLKWRVDYLKLYWLLRDLDIGTRNIFIYASYLKESQKQVEFLDTELALDAYRFADMYDTIVLFSGDSDFDYLLEVLKDMGKKIVVVSNRKHISYELMKRADLYVDLKKLRQFIEVSHKKSLKATLADGLGGTTQVNLTKNN